MFKTKQAAEIKVNGLFMLRKEINKWKHGTSDRLRNCWDKDINPKVNQVGVETSVKIENMTLKQELGYLMVLFRAVKTISSVVSEKSCHLQLV
jgi:hypothetical protein